jgi:hypothetical protein
MGLLAPIRHIADIVEAFASVNFINSSVQAVTTDDLLRAVEVVSGRRGPYTEHFVVFRTASEAFPLSEIPPGAPFGVVGSNYRFTVIDKIIEGVNNRFVCERSSSASLDKIQASAACAAGVLINENVDGDSQVFQDAVSSRFLFFTRTKTGVKVDDPDNYPPLPVPSRPVSTEGTVTPFVRPKFEKLDDLLAAFATHAVRSKGGKPYIVGPTECPPAPLRQPLVFCHTIGRAMAA